MTTVEQLVLVAIVVAQATALVALFIAYRKSQALAEAWHQKAIEINQDRLKQSDAWYQKHHRLERAYDALKEELAAEEDVEEAIESIRKSAKKEA